jgi:hypothetical protein
MKNITFLFNDNVHLKYNCFLLSSSINYNERGTFGFNVVFKLSLWAGRDGDDDDDADTEPRVDSVGVQCKLSS